MPNKSLPRTLILADIGLGDPSASGNLLSTLFQNWAATQLLQIYWQRKPQASTAGLPLIQALDAKRASRAKIVRAIKSFAPQAIYLRLSDAPLEYVQLCEALVEQTCKATDVPLVTHTFDDWVARSAEHPHGNELTTWFERMLDQATVNLVISQAMAHAYSERYGGQYHPVANGIDPALWPEPAQLAPATDKQASGAHLDAHMVVRYCGSLATDIQRDTVLKFAEAIETASKPGIFLEIFTTPEYFDIEPLKHLKKTSVHAQVPTDVYPQLLRSADALLLAYNFDPRSVAYIGLSLANKLPEYLASATPILAIGPPELPSIAYLAANDLAMVVEQADLATLKRCVETLPEQLLARRSNAKRVFQRAIEHHNSINARATFEQHLKYARQPGNNMTLRTFSRSDDVSVDETAVVHHYFRTRRPNTPGTMIDVGAHHGSACRPFLRENWLVHGFEPDPKNHAYLVERIPASDNFILNHCAVGDEGGKVLSFYAAEQSTGISSLIPFHDGHQEVAQVTTVRLDEYLSETDITQIEFLKIDTEGFDLPVLRGFPWDKIRPEVVECEFEDAKTEKIGYNLHDQAKFLLDKGYRVYVSEWHPIVQYGIPHQWKCLTEYKDAQLGEKAWGNFLAFRDDISLAEVEAMFLPVLKRSNPDKTLVAVTPSAPKPAASPAPAGKKAPAAPSAAASAANSAAASTAQTPTTPPSAPLPIAPGTSNSAGLSMISNHIKIFAGFLRSRAGISVLLAVGTAVFMLSLLPQIIISQTVPHWAFWACSGAAWLVLTHTIGYAIERARFEREHDPRIERQLTNIHQQIAQLKTAVAKAAASGDAAKVAPAIQKRLADTEQEVKRVHKQNMDIKRKLPELVDMITRISKNSSS